MIYSLKIDQQMIIGIIDSFCFYYIYSVYSLRFICFVELNNRERNPMRGSAAPGAERRSSSTTSLNENW